MPGLIINNETCTSFELSDFTTVQLSDGLIWVHLEGEISSARQWLESSMKLDNDTLDALCDELTRPRAFINVNGDLVTTLRAVYIDKDNDTDLYSIRAWMDERLLITISRDRLSAIAMCEEKIKRRPRGIQNTYQLFWLLCHISTDLISTHISELNELLNVLEDEWDNQRRIDIDKLHSVRFHMSRLQRYLLPQVETLKKIPQLILEDIDSNLDPHLYNSRWRETINTVKHGLEAMIELKERVSILHDAIQQQSNQSMNKTMFLLSIIATFFLPMTFIASLLGMNVSGIPGQNNPWAFIAVCGMMLIIGLVQWILFKRWQWVN